MSTRLTRTSSPAASSAAMIGSGSRTQNWTKSTSTVLGPFDERTDTRFRVEIYSEEWGFLFCHAGQASWIRVTDVPFVHGRDDFKLLPSMPALKDLGTLLRSVEQQHHVRFRRRNALVR